MVALVTDLGLTLKRAQLVRADAARDAEAVDCTPFTPLGLGTVFGGILAQIAALAKCVEELVEARQ